MCLIILSAASGVPTRRPTGRLFRRRVACHRLTAHVSRLQGFRPIHGLKSDGPLPTCSSTLVVVEAHVPGRSVGPHHWELQPQTPGGRSWIWILAK